MMNLQHLKTFLYVLKNLNYTRAAEELFLTQSAVSQQIRQLEQELGLKLFEQIGKKIYPTDAGRILESEATRVLTHVDRAREVMEEISGLQKGRIRIGASTTPGVYILPQILAAFRSAYPAVTTSLIIDNTRSIETHILSNALDLAFVGRGVTREELIVKPYLEDHLIPIAPVKHPLCSEHELLPGRLSKEPFIVREPGSATREAVESWARKHRIKLNVAYEFDSPEAVKMAVISGLGVSVLSAYAVAWELRTKRVAMLNVKGFRIQRPLTVIHHKDKHLAQAAILFMQTAHKMKTRKVLGNAVIARTS